MIITILIGLVVLSIIILAHELGHFVTAKAVGVRVEEFGLGFPPKLVSFKWGETRYSLNAIPFGAFNKLTGEEDPSEPRSLASKSIGARLLVLSAGSLVNLLLALLLFSIAFMIPYNTVTGQVVVDGVWPDSPALAAGIRPQDIILSVNNRPVNSTIDLNRYVQLNLGNKVDITVQHHDSTTESVKLVPRWKPPEGQGALGIMIRTVNPAIVSQHLPFWKAIPMGFNGLIENVVLYKNGIIGIIVGNVPAEFIGPVGIVQITGEIAKAGISPLLEFAAFISLILGLVNIFPLPALDGGRIVFVLLEWIRRGRRISPKTEGLIHMIGFTIMIGLLMIITYQDIIRIITGGSLLP